MKEPSSKRRRTLELQARARKFAVQINVACPKRFSDQPSSVVWNQLVRAADSQSNNLVEADSASSDDEFVYKMRVSLREAKEAKECLAKIRESPLDSAKMTAGLEQEARELSAIYATIVLNTVERLEREKRNGKAKRRGGR